MGHLDGMMKDIFKDMGSMMGEDQESLMKNIGAMSELFGSMAKGGAEGGVPPGGEMPPEAKSVVDEIFKDLPKPQTAGQNDS